MIAAALLFGVAIVAWGVPAAPAAPAGSVPAEAAADGGTAGAQDASSSPPASESPLVAPQPLPEPSQAPAPLPPAAITLSSPSRKKNKKREGPNGAGAGDEAGRFGTIELKGRIFVLGEWQRGDVIVVDSSGALVPSARDALDITVASVRPSLRWQAPQKWLSAVIEVEVTRKPDMRDGYIQARHKHLMLRAGQFKMPGSAIETASPWTLPFVRRGFLHTLLVDGLDNAWRRPGLMLRWRGADFLRPEISAGVFQGLVVTSEGLERDKDLIVAQSLSAQSLIGRVQIEPVDGVEIGAYYHYRVGTPGILRTARYWTAGADLVVDRTFASGGLRIWLDGIAGATWFESTAADGADATFVVGRSILAWRFGGVEAEQPYLEAYGTVGVLDPDTAVVEDLAVEAAVGVNVGLWQRIRVSAQAEVYKTGRNFPPGYFLGIDPDHVAGMLQVGVTF